MEYVSAVLQQETMEQCKQNAGKEQVVRMNGTVHAIRNMGEVCFVILRRREGLLQCVCSKQMARELKEEMAGARRDGDASDGGDGSWPSGGISAFSDIETKAGHLSGNQVEPAVGIPPQHRGTREIQDTGRISARVPGFFIFSGVYGDSYAEDRSEGSRRRREYLQAGLFSPEGGAGTEPSAL